MMVRSLRKFTFIKNLKKISGYWCNMISEDFLKMGINITDEHIVQMHELVYKKLIKSKVYCTSFEELEQLK